MHLYKPGRIRQTVTRILLWCYNNIFRMFVIPSGSTSPESALEKFPPKGSSIARLYSEEVTEKSTPLGRTVTRSTQAALSWPRVLPGSLEFMWPEGVWNCSA